MHYGWIGSLSGRIATETRKWAYRFAEFVSTVILPRDLIIFHLRIYVIQEQKGSILDDVQF